MRPRPENRELALLEERLREEIDDEDELTAQPYSHIDDEYAMAGKRDPKILVTTSRDPSTKLSQFAKEMKLIFPNSVRLNRGSQVMSELVQGCRSNDFTDIVVVHEHRGEPDGIIVCHLPFGPTVRITSMLLPSLSSRAAQSGTLLSLWSSLMRNAGGNGYRRILACSMLLRGMISGLAMRNFLMSLRRIHI